MSYLIISFQIRILLAWQQLESFNMLTTYMHLRYDVWKYSQLVSAAIASVPGRFFSKDTEGKKIRPGIYCIGDSAHVLTYALESGESPFSFFDHVSIYVK